MSGMEPDQRRLLRRMALSIGFSTMPFGIAFGVACAEAGLRWWEAMGFSLLVFGGSAQFAAVGVLGQGGSVAAAVAAGALLNLRSLAFGLLMAPFLSGSRTFRAVASQLAIDESTAIAMSQDEPELRRYGFLVGGLTVFVLWNLATALGVTGVGGSGTVVERLGLDATIPAAFLALLWPRLFDPTQGPAILAGMAIAAVLVPFTPPGIPIIASALGAVVAVGTRKR